MFQVCARQVAASSWWNATQDCICTIITLTASEDAQMPLVCIYVVQTCL